MKYDISHYADRSYVSVIASQKQTGMENKISKKNKCFKKSKIKCDTGRANGEKKADCFLLLVSHEKVAWLSPINSV
jgi:hypothetical protein